MSPPGPVSPTGVAGYRARLALAMALLVMAVTASALYMAQRKLAAETDLAFQRDFQNALATLHHIQDVRHAVLAERCRALVRRPRIHAALEDNAMDLLYPSAQDELRDVMAGSDDGVLQARFYRFLDAKGALLSPPEGVVAGALRPEEEAALAQPGPPERQQLGYLRRLGGERVDEVLAVPIVSTENGEVIAALVLGFPPPELTTGLRAGGMQGGVFFGGRLSLPALAEPERAALEAELAPLLRAFAGEEKSLPRPASRVFCKRLNPGSVYPPAYEVCLYPLAGLQARQRALLWQAALVCAALMLGSVAASRQLAVRLARPVEKLAVASEENRAQRQRAESALETTSAELQRAARFSADASHQLKTPVAVLRAGLEELRAFDLPAEAREEIAALVHQTFRITTMVEDLLLLSRMEAGRLHIQFSPVDLQALIDALVDDLQALPDAALVEVEARCPVAAVEGERTYLAIILQNLLENARKYNRPGGHIRLVCHEEEPWLSLRVGNHGPPIPPGAQGHIFERFHRGAMGENIPGHGLGLNLARELARLHGGELRLLESSGDWTEFELRLRLAPPAAPAYEPA